VDKHRAASGITGVLDGQDPAIGCANSPLHLCPPGLRRHAPGPKLYLPAAAASHSWARLTATAARSRAHEDLRRRDPCLQREVAAANGPAATQVKSGAVCSVTDRESPWLTLLTGTWRARTSFRGRTSNSWIPVRAFSTVRTGS
jgi:hypothetical protein